MLCQKNVLFGTMMFLAVLILLPTVQAQYLDFEISPLYINSDMCGITEIIIRNTGTQSAFEVDIPDAMYIPNCCSFTSSKTIEVLAPNEEESIPIRYCAGTLSLKGIHSEDIPITSFGNDYNIPITIHVTKNYPEVLGDRIDRLEASLIRVTDDGLTINQVGPFIGSQQGLFIARNKLDKGYFEESQEAIDSVGELIELIKTNAIGVSFTHVVVPAVIIIIFIIIVLFIHFFSSEAYEPGRPSLMGQIKTDEKSVLKSISLLESKLALLGKERLRKTDVKYYRNVQKLLRETKRHIIKNDIINANKSLSEAEMNLKVLEHRIVSLNLMKQVGDLANSV